jgi:hypothetical protein
VVLLYVGEGTHGERRLLLDTRLPPRPLGRRSTVVAVASGVPLNRAIAASVAWLEAGSRVKRNIDVGLCAHDEHAIEGPALDGLVAG